MIGQAKRQVAINYEVKREDLVVRAEEENRQEDTWTVGPSSSATTSTVERALPSSAVQARCWSRPHDHAAAPLMTIPLHLGPPEAIDRSALKVFGGHKE